jgi:hypothetical protein
MPNYPRRPPCRKRSWFSAPPALALVSGSRSPPSCIPAPTQTKVRAQKLGTVEAPDQKAAGRVRDTRMGGLVQQPAAPGAHRQHPAGRSRGTLLRYAGTACHGGVTQTKRPPANPGRFTSPTLNPDKSFGSALRPIRCHVLALEIAKPHHRASKREKGARFCGRRSELAVPLIVEALGRLLRS